jgi:hypothetical protein
MIQSPDQKFANNRRRSDLFMDYERLGKPLLSDQMFHRREVLIRGRRLGASPPFVPSGYVYELDEFYYVARQDENSILFCDKEQVSLVISNQCRGR